MILAQLFWLPQLVHQRASLYKPRESIRTSAKSFSYYLTQLERMQLKDILRICHNASHEILVKHILSMNKYTSKCRYDIKNQKLEYITQLPLGGASDRVLLKRLIGTLIWTLKMAKWAASHRMCLESFPPTPLMSPSSASIAGKIPFAVPFPLYWL